MDSATTFTAAKSPTAGLRVQCLERGMFDLQVKGSKNGFRDPTSTQTPALMPCYFRISSVYKLFFWF